MNAELERLGQIGWREVGALAVAMAVMLTAGIARAQDSNVKLAVVVPDRPGVSIGAAIGITAQTPDSSPGGPEARQADTAGSTDGSTLLHESVRRNDLAAVNALVARGAPVGQGVEPGRIVADGMVPLAVVGLLWVGLRRFARRPRWPAAAGRASIYRTEVPRL